MKTVSRITYAASRVHVRAQTRSDTDCESVKLVLNPLQTLSGFDDRQKESAQLCRLIYH